MSNQYSSIPAFDLFDTCILSDISVGKKFKEAVLHTIITYSLSNSGELIIDKHLSNGISGHFRSLYEVPDYENYLSKIDQSVSDWDSIECRDNFLVPHNKKNYNILLDSHAEYLKNLNNITGSEFAQNIFQYFIQVELEFENWFWNAGIEIQRDPNNEIDMGKSSKQAEALQIQNPLKPISKIDQENEAIDEAVAFINDEIKKLGDVYKKKKVIDICANAYEQFIPSENKKGIIEVTNYALAVFPRLKHKYKDSWGVDQFKRYLSSALSVSKNKTKGSNILRVIFL